MAPHGIARDGLNIHAPLPHFACTEATPRRWPDYGVRLHARQAFLGAFLVGCDLRRGRLYGGARRTPGVVLNKWHRQDLRARFRSFRSFDDVVIGAYLACAERVQEAENGIQQLH